MASLFEYDENGNIVYLPNEVEGSATPEEILIDEGAADPATNEVEGGGFEYGTDFIEDDYQGIDVPDSVQNTQNTSQTSQGEQIVYLGDEYNVSLLSDEIQELLVNALAPASGTIGTSTLEYFDRIISGLPSDVVYIAYKTSSTSNYDGVLYSSDDYEVNGNVVSFGDDTKEVRVVRSSYNGQNNVTQYYESDADGAAIGFDMDGDIVYYTNAVAGYPILGHINQPIGYSPFIVGAVLCALFTTILSKIVLKK